MGLHCWISHSRGIFSGIHVAVAYNVINRKLTIVNVITCVCRQCVRSFDDVSVSPFNLLCKGRQPIQDQSSVLGADILNNPRYNYYGRSFNYSPEKWLHNRICYPSNRSKQIQETHSAYSAGTPYTRQSWMKNNMHGFTDNKLLCVKSCMQFFILTLPRVLCAGSISRVSF